MDLLKFLKSVKKKNIYKIKLGKVFKLINFFKLKLMI